MKILFGNAGNTIGMGKQSQIPQPLEREVADNSNGIPKFVHFPKLGYFLETVHTEKINR